MGENKEKNNNNIVPVIIVAVVIVAVLCGVFVFLRHENVFVNNSSNSSSIWKSKGSDKEEAKKLEQAGENGEQNGDQNGEQNQEESAASLIDMKNTDNVEVVEGEKVNKSKDVSKDREINGLKLTDIQLKTENGISKFTAKVTNATGKDFDGGIVKIMFKYGEGKPDEELQASIPNIKKDGVSAIDAGTTSDVTNAKDFTIELMK